MDRLARPPRTWAADASNNEIAIIEHKNMYLRYSMHVIDEKGDQTRDVIETRDGTVARLVARDDRPLSQEENRAEQDRLNGLLASPAAYEKHAGNDVTGKKHAIEIIRMLPDAMIFSYTPGQPQTESTAGEQVVLDFKPNPAWRPPNLPSEALTGIEGRVWVDVKTRHMVRMDCDIFQAVNFGYGMLAHVYPGGKFAVLQIPLGGDRWIVSHFSEQLTLKALMVRTIRQNAEVSTASYQAVGAMSYQDAIRSLLATPLAR